MIVQRSCEHFSCSKKVDISHGSRNGSDYPNKHSSIHDLSYLTDSGNIKNRCKYCRVVIPDLREFCSAKCKLLYYGVG